MKLYGTTKINTDTFDEIYIDNTIIDVCDNKQDNLNVNEISLNEIKVLKMFMNNANVTFGFFVKQYKSKSINNNFLYFDYSNITDYKIMGVALPGSNT